MKTPDDLSTKPPVAPLTPIQLAASVLAFIVIAVCGKLEWSPVLIPSVILAWYGFIRGAGTPRRRVE